MVAWLRDNLPPDQIEHLLNPTDDKLNLNVALDDDGKRMLGWWAREMARDSELRELFKLLSARAGYHPTRRTATGPVKRTRRRGGGAVVALLLFVLMLRGLAPAPFPHARQLRAPALTLRGRQSFLLPAAEPA